MKTIKLEQNIQFCQLEELNELGDDFLDEHQEEVTPAVAKMMVENLDKYV